MGYEIIFKDDAGKMCRLFVDSEEVIRSLIHSGYEISVVETVRSCDRLDRFRGDRERYHNQQEKEAAMRPPLPVQVNEVERLHRVDVMEGGPR